MAFDYVAFVSILKIYVVTISFFCMVYFKKLLSVFPEGDMDIEEAKSNLKMAKAQEGWAEHYRDEAKYWDRGDMREKYYRKEREAADWARNIYQAIKEAGYAIEDLEKLIQTEQANPTNS